jgi:hypothetical protein
MRDGRMYATTRQREWRSGDLTEMPRERSSNPSLKIICSLLLIDVKPKYRQKKYKVKRGVRTQTQDERQRYKNAINYIKEQPQHTNQFHQSKWFTQE